jgi:hypothetical protein
MSGTAIASTSAVHFDPPRMRAPLEEDPGEDGGRDRRKRGRGDSDQGIAAELPEPIKQPLTEPLDIDPTTSLANDSQMVNRREAVLAHPASAYEGHERIGCERPKSGQREDREATSRDQQDPAVGYRSACQDTLFS